MFSLFHARRMQFGRFFGSVSGCNVVTFFGSVSGLTESFELVSGHKNREHFFLHPQSHLMEATRLPMQK